MKERLQLLSKQLEGKLYLDDTIRTLYATDASAYREMPLAVAIPSTVEDLKKLIVFANEEKTSLIPRTAGTSLAGKVYGDDFGDMTLSNFVLNQTNNKYVYSNVTSNTNNWDKFYTEESTWRIKVGVSYKF